MRIAHLTSWISRRGGGVPVVASELCRHLADDGDSEVSVLGLVGSPGEERDHDWGRANVHALRARRGWPLGYVPEMNRRLRHLDPDIVHVHGLWTYASIAAVRWHAGKPEGRVIVSPHGMLEPWALKNSGWKKAVASRLFQRRALRQAACIHALSPAERDEVRAYGATAPVAVIPNGVSQPAAGARWPEPAWRAELPAEARILLYLGRVHPKKNLPLLLRAWASREAAEARRGWHLVVAGPDENDHRAELEALAGELGIGAEVAFVGPCFGAEKNGSFACADAFVLPSLSEGLPMAVLEAWSHAVPVLTTEACNLPVGYARGAAFRLRPELPQAGVDLATALATPPEALRAMGRAGREIVRNDYTWAGAAERMRALYAWTLGADAAGDVVNLAP